MAQNGSHVLVLKTDVEARKQSGAKRWADLKAFLGRSDVQDLLKEFAKHLDSQGSVAATYRLLKGAGLDSTGTEGTFRNHWSGGAQWVRMNEHGLDFNKVVAMLNRQEPSIVASFSGLKGADHSPYPVVMKMIVAA